MARETLSEANYSGLWWGDEAAVEYPAVYQTTDRPRITKRIGVQQHYTIANPNPFLAMKRGRLLMQCVAPVMLPKLHVAFETVLVFADDAIKENLQPLFSRLRTTVKPNGVLGVLLRNNKAAVRDSIVYYGMEAGFAFSHFTAAAVPVADFVISLAEKAEKEQQSFLVVKDGSAVVGRLEPLNKIFENSIVWFINN